jgi:hypothetical protein
LLSVWQIMVGFLQLVIMVLKVYQPRR